MASAHGEFPAALSGWGAERTESFRSVRRYDRVKRCIDVCIALLLAPPALLLIAVLALLIACDGGKPFYSQVRIGRNGRLFKIWKLRTMAPDSSRVLQEYLAAHPEARKEWDETQKLRRDPRITRCGAAIRKYSLDELPQLWNVLRGQMSVVGPRPIMPEQQALYPGSAYFAMRPGLTGLWQVSARNESPFASRAAYDTRYAESMSLGTDLWILVLTVGVVVRGTGF
jgi:lipopolysaccharide/colanic/teichoic acid biosynthesis glycosyltransferase